MAARPYNVWTNMLMNPTDSAPLSSSRRHFIKASTMTAAGLVAAPAILGTKSSAASPGDELRVGLIGCGGPGGEAAMNALRGDNNAVLTAIADIYEDKIEEKLEAMHHDEALSPRVKVDKKKRFVGLDAYQALLDSGVDVVILATPPGFRPLH